MSPVRLRRRRSGFLALRDRIYRQYRARGYGQRRAAYIADATAGRISGRKRRRR